uniref:Chemokine interleukin-8-like domain-containing protein n=1 Tax=Salarias fasciatus TaxID=181472 RepID=A0A672GW62_SALFA
MVPTKQYYNAHFLVNCTVLSMFTSEVIPFHQLQSYKVQKSRDICISAVIFLTYSGEMICADPKQEWVRRYMITMKRRTEQILPKYPPHPSRQ